MRMGSWLARYAPFVVEHFKSCEAMIVEDVKRRANGRTPVIADLLVDTALTGRITVVVLPDEAIEANVADAERNAKIAALVCSDGFQMFRNRNDVVTMVARGHSVTCKSLDACFAAFFAMEQGTISVETLLDADLHAVGS